jgi:hypothetical protein
MHLMLAASVGTLVWTFRCTTAALVLAGIGFLAVMLMMIEVQHNQAKPSCYHAEAKDWEQYLCERDDGTPQVRGNLLHE